MTQQNLLRQRLFLLSVLVLCFWVGWSLFAQLSAGVGAYPAGQRLGGLMPMAGMAMGMECVTKGFGCGEMILGTAHPTPFANQLECQPRRADLSPKFGVHF